MTPRRWAIGLAVVLPIAVLLGVRSAFWPSSRIEWLLRPENFEVALNPQVNGPELQGLTDREVKALLDLVTADTPDPGRFYREYLRRWTPRPLAAFIQAKLDAAEARSNLEYQKAVYLLSALGPRAASAIPALMATETLTNRELHTRRRLVSICLGVLRFTSRKPTNVERWLSTIPGDVRGDAMARVVRFATNPPPELLDPLLATLNDSSWAVAHNLELGRALAAYGPLASNAVPRLRQRLRASDLHVRDSAAYALGFIAPECAEEAAAVLMADKDNPLSLANLFGPALYARLGSPAGSPTTQAVVQLLEAHLDPWSRTPGPGVAGGAVALWRITRKPTPALIDALAWAIEHHYKRAESLRALAEIGPPATNAIPALRRASRQPWVKLRELAGQALDSIEGRRQP